MVLLSTAYLPPIEWFALAAQAKRITHENTEGLKSNPEVIMEACEHFQKASVRNKAIIGGPNGLQMLSIPLRKGKNHQKPIKEVAIAYDEPWQRLHWRTLQNVYRSAPFFEHYADKLRPLYEQRFETLFEHNMAFLSLLNQVFSLNLTFLETTTYEKTPALVLDARAFFEHKKENIALFQTTYYPQVFESAHGFREGLSAVDLLFCMGPKGGADYLRKLSPLHEVIRDYTSKIPQ